MSNSNHVLAEYMRRVEAGEPVDVDAICAAHPEIADELRSYVAGAAMVQDMLKGSDTSEADAQQETLKPGAAHATDSELIGQMFGRYQVERQLGEGAMGAVYLAHDTQLDRPVALKIPKVGYGEKEEFLTRFQREAQAAAKLNHPGICSVFDFGEQDGRPYITMAYIDGQPLSRFIGTTQVNQQWIVEVIKQVADALEHAHKSGVVHRDLKAGNVLIDKDGKPVVTDFGLARKVEQNDESRITQEGAILGTPGYMSPEQVEGNQSKIGPATDIYALGVMLFELLTGELPFRGSIHSILAQIARDEPQNPQKLNPDAHPKLCALSLEMMSKEISKRPASMQTVVERLSEWSAEPSPEERAEQKKQDERQQKLESGKQKVSDLIKRGQYAQAISLLEKMSSITDADAVGYASWARDELKRVKELPKKVREGIPSLVATAKKLVKKHDYGQAAEMLQQIPLELRTPEIQELTEKAIDLQDEVDLLLADLHECVNRKQYDGIDDNVKRLLQLKPKNKFAQDLWEALNTYSSVPAKQRKYRFDEKGKLLPKGSSLSGTVVIALLVALLSFGGMTYALTIYLKSGNETLTVQIDDELLANGDITLTFDGKDHVITGPEFRLTVSPGQYGYEVRQGNSIIRNPQQFTVVKDGRNVLEVGTSTSPDVSLVDSGQQVSSIQFPGKWGNRVEIPSLIFNEPEYTIEAWVHPAYDGGLTNLYGIATTGIPREKWLGSGFWLSLLRNNENSASDYSIFVKNLHSEDWESDVKSTDYVLNERWSHIAVTRIKDITRVFLNGQLVGQQIHDRTSEPTEQCVLLGALGKAHHFKGQMDEIRISNVGRYDKNFEPRTRFEPDNNTVALYHCDGGTGKLLRDSSGNEHHGTMFDVRFESLSDDAPTAIAAVSQALPDANPNFALTPKTDLLVNVQDSDMEDGWNRASAGSLVFNGKFAKKVTFPTQIPNSYELHLSGTVEGEVGQVAVALPVADRHCALLMRSQSSNSRFGGLEMVDGKPQGESDSPLTENLLADGVFDLTFRVSTQGKNATIEVISQGKPVLNWSGEKSRLDLTNQWKPTSSGQVAFGGFISGQAAAGGKLVLNTAEFAPVGDGNARQSQAGQSRALSLPEKVYARAESSISGLNEARELTVECWAKTTMYSNLSTVIALGVNRPVDPQGLCLELSYQYFDNDNQGHWKAVLINGVGKNEPIAGSNNRTREEMNVWTHLACTLKDGALRLFVDGKLQDQKMYDPSLRFGDVETLTLGAAPHRKEDGSIGRTWFRYAGLIDEVRVSKKVRYTDDFEPSGRFFEDADTLVLYHCDDDEKLLRDSSGHGNHATMFGVSCEEIDPGAPTASSGSAVNGTKTGGSQGRTSFLKFSRKASVPAHVVVPSLKYRGNHPLTIEAWVRMDDDVTEEYRETLLSFAHAKEYNRGEGIFVAIDPSNWQKTVKWPLVASVRHKETGSEYLRAPNSFPFERWTHLAAVLDQQELSLFVNGAPAANSTLKTSFEPSDENFMIGAFKSVKENGAPEINNFFTGAIDEIRLSRVARYSGQFTPQEVFLSDSDTMALYHCDEGTGTVLRDSSGNEHHGTLFDASFQKLDSTEGSSSDRQARPDLKSTPTKSSSASSDQGFTLKSGAQLHGTFLQRNPTGVHSVSLDVVKHNDESWDCEFKSICMHNPQTGATHATGFQFQANLFENPDKTFELRIGDVISNQSGREIRDTAGTWKEKLWTAAPYFLSNSVMKLRPGPWPTGALPANESWLIKTGEFGGHSWLHRESSVALQSTAFPNPIDPARQKFVAGLSPFGNRSKYRVRTKWDSKNLYLLTTFDLPKLTVKHKVLIRAIHDDDAWVWINGKPVDFRDCGSRHQYLWGYNNSYSDFTIGPKTRSLLKTGTNQIAVRCTQNSGEQICDIGIKLREEF